MNARNMKRIAIFAGIALLPLWGTYALAQVRIVGAISGTVKDATGALVPNAKVVLKDEGTGITKETTSNAEGQFLFPDLSFGSFQVTVTAPGFQTAVIDHIMVEASKTSDITVNLRVGQQADTVTVEASALTLETSSNLVSNTITRTSISELPLLSRNTLLLAQLVPGQVSPRNSNVSGADTHFNNMPGGAVNVTVDGINDASNGYKSGGTVFYMTVPSRVGATEEIQVESGGLGADSGAQSGTNLKFITRRGTNQYHGSVFYQPQSELFNANSFIRNATGQGFRVRNRVHNFGGNFGGRLVPFGYLKDKLFFFINYEYLYNPQQIAKAQNVLLPQAQQGVFTYRATDGTLQSVNLLQIAATNGFQSTISPAISYILGQQNQALGGGYQLPLNNNFNYTQLNWAESNNLNQYFPTTRLDYYVTPSIQLTATWSLYHSFQPGTRQFPIAGYKPVDPFRIGGYFTYSGAVQWTVSPRTFNEFRYGVQHSGDTNEIAGYPIYNTYNNQVFRVGLPGGTIATLRPDRNNTTGRHYITTIYDTATLNRGQHTITVGGTYRRTDWRDTTESIPYPLYSIGAPASDPASAIFNTATLPGVNPSDIGAAVSLYDVLTGRISRVSATAYVDPKTQQYGGPVNSTWTRSHMGGVYAQDRWRIRPDLTLNFGLRWEFQGDMFNVDNIVAIPDLSGIYGPSVGLFTPGVLNGNLDPLLKVGSHAFKPDYVNPAPNFGFAWNPRKEGGFMGKLLGGSKTVIRGHYGIVYYDEGTQFFATNVNNNPGGKQQNSSFTPGQAGIPFNINVDSLLSNGLPAYTSVSPTSFVTTLRESDSTFNNTLNGMKPTLRTPYVINWNFGIQREVARNTVLEVNYVGNQSHHGWRTGNLNEVNIFENGFLKEFINAQNNLKVNAANGVANNFANLGFAGDAPLPIFETAFGPRGAVAALATAQGFGNTAYITNLQQGAAGALANSLATNSQTVCRMFGNTFTPCSRIGTFNAPGPYPINFFLVNPFSAGAFNYVEDTGWNSYNGLQVVLRKRSTRGLTAQVNYTFAKGLTNERVDNQNQSIDPTTRRNLALDRAPSAFDIRQVFQIFGTYDLPVGKGRAWAINNRVLDTIAGGWTLGSIFNIQSGSPIPLTGGFQTVNVNGGQAGNGIILAPGVTLDDIQNALNNSQGPNTNRYAIDRKFIGSDGRANPQYLITPSTPGQFGQFLYIYGKNYWSLDVSLVKNFQVTEHTKFTLWAGTTNIFNHPEWGVQTPLNIQSTTFGQVGSPMNGPRAMQFRGVFTF